MKVKIYLRLIIVEDKEGLALFDSNRNGGINELITDVNPGDTVVWKLDSHSGIREIIEISSADKNHPIFKSNPRKSLDRKEFRLKIENGLKSGIEKYDIKCILWDNSKLKIDPFLRIPPPPSR